VKCGVYIRVSTDKEEQKSSLENQERYFYNIIAERGWELYKFYVDVESGTKERKRENLKNMIADARERKIDVILSKELSRLARNGKLSYEIKEIAEQNNVHIITYDNAINSIEGNIHMFGLYAWIYEQESQRTSERIKIAFNSKAKNGDFTGSHAPYGYQVNDKKLYLAENGTPEVIQRIFDLYVTGLGVDAIAHHLSLDGIPTPSNVAAKKNASKFWQGSSIKNILTNPHFTGDLVQHRETTKSVTSDKREKVSTENQITVNNTHVGIITHQQFNFVQKMMKSRKRNFTKFNKHLFTNVVYCEDCGSGMWFRQNRLGYICGSYARHGNIACTNHSIPEKELEQVILKDIHWMYNKVSDKKFLSSVKALEKKRVHVSQKKLSLLDAEITSLKVKRRRYIEMLADNLISHDEYRDILSSKEAKVNELNETRSELKASLQENQVTKEIETFRNVMEQFSPIEEVTKELLHYMVKRIVVSKERTIKVTYRFSIFSNYLPV